ncbi:SusC/RagA family TonB-linked outer membrane protein [Dokdonia sp. Hel_I_53]|uniref:SusC/RagA family TonB-linked outer membrane protein n=1 Tax=Dokdonia sp. Hel_I_53 TaxID=1566287 RepID=UPI001198E02A|nr:SusC/RagA family TonB-linked outer membrane protein [Dokdonia sp. Hel_I_53]TVZ52909.1 iron complex outermembrane receptor protein [Dokdonia sp. Hel_I_53]
MKKVLFKSMFLFVAILFTGIAQAQIVTGKVTEENGPLPGANVIVKGTSNGATTDFDGNYSLNNVPADATLVFSYVGFVSQEVAVDGRTNINVNLATDNALDEVVLIGYGSTRIKDATGAVAVVSSEDFNGGVISSPEQLIQGKTAGVQITQSTGEPGAGINLSIRGTTSVRANNNPLFVVDGVPLGGGETTSGGADIGFGGSSAKNPLNFLNPNDIESISVLKDASATAIYGSRAANGVVLIQTKSGRGNSKGKFEFDTSVSVASAANRFDLLNREDYLNAIDTFGGNSAALDQGFDTDWQDVVLKTTYSRNNVLSYSKGYTGGNLRASFGYGKQYGVVENSSLERISGRLNANKKFFNDKLKVDLQASISRVNDETPPISTNAGFQGDLLGSAYSANPTWPSDPNFSQPGDAINPANLLANYLGGAETDRFLGSLSAEYKFTEEFSAKVTGGYDNAESQRFSMLGANVNNINNGTPGNGRGSINDLEIENTLLNATLNYEKEFENSNLSVLVGYEYQEFKNSGRNISGFGFGTDDIGLMTGRLQSSVSNAERVADNDYLQLRFDDTNGLLSEGFNFNSSGQTTPYQNAINDAFDSNVQTFISTRFNSIDELQSVFARANYSIADKYLFTATVRRDGSTRFGENERYGTFPSGAFAWKINQEDFIGDAISTLKLRLGYGVTGSQEGLGTNNFTNRRAITAATFNENGVINGGNAGLNTNIVAFANPDLRWEETTQYNVGVDFGINNDRFNGTLDLYYKDTDGFLLNQQSAQPAPQPFFFGNVDGNIINKGVELSLNYDFIQQEETSLNFGFNVSYNENELQNFGGSIPFGQIFGQGLTGAFAQLLEDGRPLFSYYLREFEGYDENGLQITDDVQRFVDKSALPNVNLGISTSFRHENWDASLFFAGQFGHYIYNNTANAFFTAGSINNGRNVTADVLTSGEQPINAPDVSTRYLEKGDFLRLQNASIGYNLNLNNTDIFKSFRIYVNGQNLFVITDYSGLDPEVNVTNVQNNVPSRGIDYVAFPRPRTYTLGVNATF